MKYMFFLVVLSVVLGVTAYVFVRGWQSFPSNLWVRIIYTLIFALSVAAFFVKMFMGDKLPEGFSSMLSTVGFTWLIAVIYLFFYVFAIDIVRFANHFFHFFPDFIKNNYSAVKLSLAMIGIVSVSVVLAFGNHKFNNPEVTSLDITLDKPQQNKELTIVMASDLHLSSYINRENLKRYVTLINSQKPDIVLLAGDVADMNIAPLVNEKMAEVLAEIKAKYGVYAITGNHEFYGGDKEKIYDYIKSAGIVFLRDTAVMAADSSLYLIGRDDRTNRYRATLSNLVKGLRSDIPKILLDHQPFHLEEAEQNGIDLQLSGHTHNGQFWPGNHIVRWMFELPYGYKKKGNTHYYVSSGLGLWGPKYRIGTVSEILLVHLRY
ncbi:MAG: metallophosphoesterase [Rikenellaceae bacterium]